MKRFALSVVLTCGAFALAGCSLDSPSKMTTSKPALEHERFVENADMVNFDQQQVERVAAQYIRHGEGPLEVTVTYDPRSKTATAMHAGNTAAQLVEAFGLEGVDNVQANIMPVLNSGASKVMVAYDGYNALAPKGCEMISGYKDRSLEADEDYELGCTVDTLLARQVARPQDLNGRAQTGHTNDAQRAVTGVERYRSGIPGDALGGDNASEN